MTSLLDDISQLEMLIDDLSMTTTSIPASEILDQIKDIANEVNWINLN